MKKLIAVTAFSLLVLSCSDKLSESKVEQLVNDCLSKEPSYGINTINTGKVTLLTKDEILFFKKLQSKGLLTIEAKPSKERYGFGYNLVKLTNKAKPFVLDSVAKSNTTNYTFRLYTKKLDKIGSIQEIPAMNMAEVNITYIKDDKTPFYEEMERDKTDFITKKIRLKKTENNGWVYCE